jgi:voltage-gated potassium channel
VIGRFHDLMLAEFPVHNTPLQGKTIRDTSLREYTGRHHRGRLGSREAEARRPDLELEPHCVSRS